MEQEKMKQKSTCSFQTIDFSTIHLHKTDPSSSSHIYCVHSPAHSTLTGPHQGALPSLPGH